MQDPLFENQERLGDALFLKLAENLDLPALQLEIAIAERKCHDRVRADFSGDARSGVNRTPIFFINRQRYNVSYDFDSPEQSH